MSYLLLCKPTVRDPIKRMGGKIQHCGVTLFQNCQKKAKQLFQVNVCATNFDKSTHKKKKMRQKVFVLSLIRNSFFSPLPMLFRECNDQDQSQSKMLFV